MTLAASDCTRTPTSAASTSRKAVVSASRNVDAARSNAAKATPSRRFNSMSPHVAQGIGKFECHFGNAGANQSEIVGFHGFPDASVRCGQ